MMRTFVLACGMLLFSAVLSAQDHFYITGDDVTANGITFAVRRSSVRLALSNVANEKLKQRIKYANGEEVAYEDYRGMSLGPIRMNTLYRAISETFSELECAPLISNGDRAPFIFAILPDGTVDEVSLSMTLSPRMLAITPDQYATLERNIKQYVRFEPGKDLPRLQFCRMHMEFYFEWMKDFRWMQKNDRGESLEGEAID
jgi:hypothetical protein